MVAIIPLIFSPGINDGDSKSIRSSAGAAAFPLVVDGPGAVESWDVEAAADAWEDGTEEPGSVRTTEFGVPPALFLLLLRFRPLLG